MIINELFERFIERSPLPVAIRAVLERVLSPEKRDQGYALNTEKQYTGKLLFSRIFELMGAVVLKSIPL